MLSTNVCSSLSMRLVRSVLVTSAALFLSLVFAGKALAGPMFIANLDGAQEVPPNASAATGVATFAFNSTLTELSYELSVFGLFDVTAAHIHLAPAGANGSIVLWLYPGSPPAVQIPGETNGLLAQGTLTAANFVGAWIGRPLTDLLAEMTMGNTYVNVHNVVFPAGEIRGQIRTVSEPKTLAVFALGLLVLVTLRRRRAFCTG